MLKSNNTNPAPIAQTSTQTINSFCIRCQFGDHCGQCSCCRDRTALRQAQDTAQSWIRLSDDSWQPVPDGADVDSFRRYMETKLRLAANPKKRQKQVVRSSRRSKRVNYAERVLSGPFDAGMRATARRMDGLAEDEPIFVNGIVWDIPFSGEPIPYDDDCGGPAEYGLPPVG